MVHFTQVDFVPRVHGRVGDATISDRISIVVAIEAAIRDVAKISRNLVRWLV